ncbi:MAG TPA: GNAT family N-acetyltransferase [Ferruginibacter sp.]|nr:GNAT family N-acetyltransferase [Ferruginibacter sp.]
MEFNISDIIIRKINTGEKVPFSLLLLSDDTVDAINNNLTGGELYIATIQEKIAGAFILKLIETDTIEIKNIAVDEAVQGNGIGSILLQYIIESTKARKLKSLIVGTCDQCNKEIRFYQKSGFKIFSIKKNFFIDNYTNPIYENDVQIRDMVMLQINIPNDEQ